jgi:hypothetical protein
MLYNQNDTITGSMKRAKRMADRMDRLKIVVHQTASVDGKLTTAPGVLLLFGDERWQAVAGGDLVIHP